MHLRRRAAVPMAGGALARLIRRPGILLVAGIALGLAAPPLAAALSPWLAPGVALLLFLTVLRLDVAEALAHIRRPGLMLLATLWLLLAAPLLVAAARPLLALPPGMAAALVLMAAAPPLASAPAIARFLSLDAALVLVLVAVAGLAAPLTLPLVLPPLAGEALPVAPLELLLRLALLIGGAGGVAVLVRRLAGQGRVAAWALPLDGATVALLALLAVAIMDGMTARILATPGKVALYALAAAAAHLLLIVLGAAAFAPLGRRGALSLGYCTGTRNMLLVVAALGVPAQSDIFLFFAAYQFPIYLLPVLARPLAWRALGPPA